jgi:hypothetical protein
LDDDRSGIREEHGEPLVPLSSRKEPVSERLQEQSFTGIGPLFIIPSPFPVVRYYPYQKELACPLMYISRPALLESFSLIFFR